MSAPGHGPARAASRAALTWALGLTTVTMVVEAAAGWWSGSLALLADAGHMLTDAAALGVALFAARLAARPAAGRRSFGHHRAEILAALANGVVLGGVAAGIVSEALARLAQSRTILAGPMLVAAAVGLVVNLVCAAILQRASHEGLNVRGAFLHVVGDTLGSVGAIVAGGVIWSTGWTPADVIAACAVAVLILFSSVRLVRDAVDVLLESVPRHLDADEIAAALESDDAVRSIHDLHVWAVTEGFECLSCHVVLGDGADGDAVLERLAAIAAERFRVDHTTFQLERVDRQAREHTH